MVFDGCGNYEWLFILYSQQLGFSVKGVYYVHSIQRAWFWILALLLFCVSDCSVTNHRLDLIWMLAWLLFHINGRSVTSQNSHQSEVLKSARQTSATNQNIKKNVRPIGIRLKLRPINKQWELCFRTRNERDIVAFSTSS